MKKIIFCVAAAMLFSVNAPAAVTVKYSGSGVGFHLGFDVLDDAPEVDVAFDVGAQGTVAFSLDKAGEVQYCPSAGVLFGGKTIEYLNWDAHYFAMEWYLNIADVKYLFPIPQAIIVRPFVGLGPMIAIDHESIEYKRTPVNQNFLPSDYDDTNVDAGFNVFAGAEFRFSQKFVPYIEMRGKLGDYDAFKFTGGMNFAIGK